MIILSKELDELRKKIDIIDQDICKLLDQRAKIVKEIAIVKKEHNIPIIDQAREKNIYNKI